MFSLTYSRAYDPYHTVFRMLAVSRNDDQLRNLPFDTLRIVDFYHCFPWLLDDLSSYSKISGFQRDKNEIVRKYPRSRFDVLPDKHLVFQRMIPSQLAARAALINVEAVELDAEYLSFKHFNKIPDRLRDALDEYQQQHRILLSFLTNKLIRVPLFGPGGLKDRSGLGEFRYDII